VASPSHFRYKEEVVRTIAIIVCALASWLSSPRVACAAPSPEWQQIADDLEQATVAVNSGGFFTSSAILLRTSLRRYRVRVIRSAEFGWPRSDARTLAKASGALVAMNANFFDEQGHALGVVVSRGTLIQPLHQGGNTLTGVFQVTSRGPEIVLRKHFQLRDVLEAVQAGPRLLHDRKPTQTSEQSAPLSRRAGVCIDDEHRLIFFCVGSGLSSVGFKELQALLQSIHCVDALNFDGGGSAQLYVREKLPGSAKGRDELFIRGHDDVPVVVGLSAQDP